MSEDNTMSSDKSEVQQSESKKAANGITGGLVCAVLFAIVTYLMYSRIFEFVIGKILVFVVGFFAFVCILVVVSCFFDWKEAKKVEKLAEETRREEKEFSQIQPEMRALRAEKMFRMNQKELMRYYDMNLAQTKFLSVLGNMMIFLGLGIVVATLIIYVSLGADKLLLVIGSMSGIIVDFVGAIFIKMYTGNIKAAVKFHAKFAESNNLLLANSIANKIEDDNLRERTLSDISKEIVLAKKSRGMEKSN